MNGVAYPHGLISGFERNESNLLTRLYFQSSEDGTSREHRYQYDEVGRVKQVHTPRGTTQIVWGNFAQPTEIVKPDQSSFSFSYDAERNLISIERSDGCQYKFEYTPDGQISQTTSFDQVQTNYTYDRAERLSEILHCSGRISFEYDQVGHIARVKAHGKNRGVEDHYLHTLGGKLIRAHNRFSNVSYTYLGTKLVSEEQGRFSFTNQYQDNGLLRSQRYDDGTEVIYEHDQFGTVCGLTIYSNGSEREDSIKFEYDELQRLSIITCSAGKERREFDGIGRLKHQIWTGFERKYHFNAQHYLSLIIDSEKGAQHYQYDELGQLERVKTETSEESYVYDSFGNFNDESAQRKHDRLIEYQGIRYDYDELGNRTSSQGNGREQYCTYDAKGQLIVVESEGHLCQFEYDALGRRTKKISENGTTEFIWQGSHLVGEYSRSGYWWYLYQPNSFVPLALIENGECYFYQCNQIGTPERLVDSNGQVVWKATYDTFGFAHVEIETVKNNLRLQGQYFDIETGLHYNLARYYDPQIGRFIQPDLLGLLGGTNHYQFAPNPVSWVDPLGLCAKEDTPTLLAGHNDNSPEKSVYYAMGSGNYGNTLSQTNPSYSMRAIAPHAVQKVGIDYAVGITEILAAGMYNTTVDIVAGLGGVIELATGDVSSSADLIESIQTNYSYIPRTDGAGRIGRAISPYVAKYEETMMGIGNAALEQTDSPLIATIVQKSPEIITTLVGGATTLKAIGKSSIPNSSLQSILTKIPEDEYIAVKNRSVHNVNADTLVLGKYRPTVIDGIEDWSIPGPDSYVAVAKNENAMYFDLGAEWGTVTERFNLTDDEMFDAFNIPILDQAVESGKDIKFTHDPRIHGGFLEQEWGYLKKVYNFKRLKEIDGVFYAK